MKKLVTVATVAVAMMFGLTARADTKKFDDAMAPVVAAYLDVQKALAGDSEKGVTDSAKKIEALAAKVDGASVTGEHAAHYKMLPGEVKAAAAKLAAAKGIDAQREAFKDLSKPMAMWATMSKPAGVYVAHCPMAKADWLQPTQDIKNPYYGSKMLGCGAITSSPDGAPAKPMQHMNKMKMKM